jgi:uncharacterized protein
MSYINQKLIKFCSYFVPFRGFRGIFSNFAYMLKTLLILLGTIALFLGVIGIFVPGLPTTPFLLLTTFLYLKGSKRLYNWLVKNKFLSKYITNYQRRKVMTLRQKIYSISVMWFMIILSAGLLVHPLVAKLILLSSGIIGTVVMGFVVPLANDELK